MDVDRGRPAGDPMHEEVIATLPPLPEPPLPPVPADPAAAASARRPIEYPFLFDGSATEYFRIWIVNLALSILSLGIFSAWAKVRTRTLLLRQHAPGRRAVRVPGQTAADPQGPHHRRDPVRGLRDRRPVQHRPAARTGPVDRRADAVADRAGRCVPRPLLVVARSQLPFRSPTMAKPISAFSCSAFR